MGNACGITKKDNKEIRQISRPLFGPICVPGEQPPPQKESQIGPFLLSETPSETLLKTLGKWNSMIAGSSLEHHPFHKFLEDSKNTERFVEMLQAGPPAQYRWQAWLAIRGVLIEDQVEKYHSLPLASEEVMIEIDKDIGRAYPEHPYFDVAKFGETGQQSLRRILGKFAEVYPEVGYCQGMNFIVGFLLMVSGSSEVEVYFFFEKLVHDFDLIDFFSKEMPGLKQILWIFNRKLEKRHPKLSNHFRRECFTEDFWVLKWFMTLFTMSFTTNVVIRLWDIFLVRGQKFLLQTAFAVLNKHERQLLRMDAGELLEFFKSLQSKDYEDLIRAAQNVRVSSNFINRLEKRYKKMSIVLNEPTAPVPLQKFNTEFLAEEVPLEAKSPNAKAFLPNIHQRRKIKIHSDDSQQIDSYDSEGDDNIDVKNILKRLFSDQSRECIKRISSFQKLKVKKNSLIEAKISFINRLPI